MAEKKPYLVTELAGPWVAGRRVRDRSAPIMLTESEADHEVRAGTLRPAPEAPAPKAPAAKGKKG